MRDLDLLFLNFLLLLLLTPLLTLLDIVDRQVRRSEKTLRAEVICFAFLFVSFLGFFVALRCMLIALCGTGGYSMVEQLRWQWLLFWVIFDLSFYSLLLFSTILHLIHFLKLFNLVSDLVSTVQAFLEIVEEALQGVNMWIIAPIHLLFDILFF